MEEEEEMNSPTAAAAQASPKLIETLKSSVTANGDTKELTKTITTTATTNNENVAGSVSNGDILHTDKALTTASSGKDEADGSVLSSNVDLNGNKENNSIETTSNRDENEDEVAHPPREMATSPEAAKSAMEIEEMDDNAVDLELPKEPKDEVENDPNFAVICSFLAQFGTALEIRYSIWQLKMMFEDYSKGRLLL